MLCCCLLVFFFKQKTAYEMRISDWSSDVCSSDLLFRVANLGRVAVTLALSPADAGKVRPGSQIEILAGDRRSVARVDFVSPILDETTRLASVIAVIDNRAGQWRVGEPVTAELGRASCRERVCPYVLIAVVAGSFKNKQQKHKHNTNTE